MSALYLFTSHFSRRRRLRLLLAMTVAAGLFAVTAAHAAAAEPWWNLDVAAAPTNLPPQGEGQITVIATNLGGATADGSVSQVSVSEKLPPQLKVLSLEGVRRFSAPGRARTGYFGLHKLKPEEEKLEAIHREEAEAEMTCPSPAEIEAKGNAFTCTYGTLLPVFESLIIKIRVKVESPPGTEASLPNEATVEGGGAPSAATVAKPLTVNPAPTPFAVDRFEMTPELEGGEAASQSGSHPYQLTNILDFKLTREEFKKEEVLSAIPALPKDLSFRLPPGLLGNPTAVPRCSEADFSAAQNTKNLCPASSAIGVAVVHVTEPQTLSEAILAAPVFNLEPAFGEPARFGFFVAHVLVYIDTAVNGEEEYAATATVRNASQTAEVLGSIVSLWGNPANKVHDGARGFECVEGEKQAEERFDAEGKEEFTHCPTLEEEGVTRSTTPFLIAPTACRGPLHTTLEGVSWPRPGAPSGIPIPPTNAPLPAMNGCESLEFDPSMSVFPDTPVGSTPTGLNVGVHVPQTGTVSEEGRATSAVKATTVTLPQGLLLNPGAADGLASCFAFQNPGNEIGLNESFPEGAQLENNHFTERPPTCVNTAKVGTVTIKTPLLDHPICPEPTPEKPKPECEASVYLAHQNTEPFAPPLVLYIVVNDRDDGVKVKLAGTTTPDPATGQLTSTFENTPQVPFEDLKIHFFDEGRSSVSTPGRCGTYTTTSLFTPWSGGAQASPSTSFDITSGPGGKSCTPPLPLTPSLQAGPLNPGGTTQAGSFSPFSVTVTRPDGDEAISGLDVTLPKGVAGVLANVNPCPEPQAELGTCGPDSLIGHATTVSGLGPQPFTLRGGNVYLTVGYGGGPFGLSVVFSNIVAGPFQIGTVVVRGGIFVDQFTAQVTVKTNVPTFVETVPHVRKGVPVQLKQTNVETFGTLPNGKGFQFNPTNCSPLTATAGFLGDEGGTGSSSSVMEFTGCNKLAFNPGFAAEVTGQGSKPNGVTFKVITTSQGLGAEGIAKVFVALPIQLPSRLSTIQKACRDFQFEANPVSGCPQDSNIGQAKIRTPVLKNPLSGPAYLVSHGNASFPDVEFVLQGEGTERGIKLILDGKTDIKKGITYSRFESTPDAPFTRFETVLPAGPHSALTSNVPESKHFNLCGQKLVMPTEIYGQNGVLIKQKTNIKITGCKAVKKCSSRSCKLAAALKKCHKIKARKKRKACERAARKKYAAKKKQHKPHK
jgi:hypothetical protein